MNPSNIVRTHNRYEWLMPGKSDHIQGLFLFLQDRDLKFDPFLSQQAYSFYLPPSCTIDIHKRLCIAILIYSPIGSGILGKPWWTGWDQLDKWNIMACFGYVIG